MPNPILPLWEYIPDGEPRVFGDRVYLYGSHDRAASDVFCDFKLKVWSASVDDLNNWTASRPAAAATASLIRHGLTTNFLPPML